MTEIPTTVATSICLDCGAVGETWDDPEAVTRRRIPCRTCDGRGYVAFATARVHWPVPVRSSPRPAHDTTTGAATVHRD